jgi:hypothetical protein
MHKEAGSTTSPREGKAWEESRRPVLTSVSQEVRRIVPIQSTPLGYVIPVTAPWSARASSRPCRPALNRLRV